MAPALDLRLRQHLALTPQLQQALRLLQLSALEFALKYQDRLAGLILIDGKAVAYPPEEQVAFGVEFEKMKVDGPVTRIESGTHDQLVEMTERYLAPDKVDAYLDYARRELGEHVAIFLKPEHWLSADLGAA